MAVITPDRFDPLLRYVGVRLQQGVPLVDADWNEAEDVRKFELRAFLKWFVGDGVPEGNDGFRIMGTSALNDVTIAAGLSGATPAVGNYRVGLQHVGRCLVDGLDVLIQADTSLRAQPLHASQATAAARSAAWGVPTVAELPNTDTTVLLYLDVWERLVTPTEDPSLVFAGIGTESCARTRREWVVRWRSGATVPAIGDSDYLAGHGYCPLAEVTRRASSGVVLSTDVTDLRQRRLLVPPATLIEDMLGTTVERYRAGLDRPPISLRTAINALMRGELPGGGDTPIAPSPTATDEMTQSFSIETSGHMLAFWHSNRIASVQQVFASRWMPGSTIDSVGNLVQITAGATAHTVPHGIELPNRDVLVVYETNASDIHYRRAPALPALPVAVETPVTTTSATERQPFVVRAGEFLVFFWHRSSPSPRWVYQRRRYDPTWAEGSATWTDAAPVEVSSTDAASPGSARGQFHAVVDSAGHVWIAFRTLTNNIAVTRLTPPTGTLGVTTIFDSGGTDQRPFLVSDGLAGVFLFWQGESNLFGQHFTASTSAWDATNTALPDTNVGPSGTNVHPTATRTDDGAIWLFWASQRAASGNYDIWCIRRSPLTGAWGSARMVVASSSGDDSPFALSLPNGVIWLAWRTNRAGSTLANYDLYHKQIVTVI